MARRPRFAQPAIALAALALSISASDTTAQSTVQGAGFFHQCAQGGSGRGTTAASTELLRIANGDYRDWGVSGSSPGAHRFHGLRIFVQDQLTLTPEAITVVGFGEDRAAPHLPDLAARFVQTSPIQLPPGGGGGQAYDLTVNFATPAHAPLDQDVFVGVELPPAPLHPIDGLSLHFVRGVPNAQGVFDIAGRGLPRTPPEVGYGTTFATGSGAGRRNTEVQWFIDLLLGTTSGVATAVTNQTSFTVSSAPPGTASFFSGLHPDAGSPPFNAGRADNLGFRVHDHDLAGDPVFFVVSIGFAPRVFLGAGETGTICTDLNAAIVLGPLTADAAGVASIAVDLGAAGSALRSTLAGARLAWQGVGLDGAVLRGSACAMQRL